MEIDCAWGTIDVSGSHLAILMLQSLWQCVAVCVAVCCSVRCSVLQCVLAYYTCFQISSRYLDLKLCACPGCTMLQCVLQCGAAHVKGAACCSMLQHVAACCSMLQHVAVSHVTTHVLTSFVATACAPGTAAVFCSTLATQLARVIPPMSNPTPPMVCDLECHAATPYDRPLPFGHLAFVNGAIRQYFVSTRFKSLRVV